MANKGSFAATATAAVLVPAATETRTEVTLQHLSGDPVYLAFGDDTPVVNQGLVLSSDFASIVIDDHRSGFAVRGICGPGNTATGAWSADRG